MAVAFKLKRSSISGRAPDATSLDYGELAVNTFDGVIYLKKNDGNGDSIVPIQQVTEYNFHIDSISLDNTTSNNLSGVLRDFDNAITAAALTGSGGGSATTLNELTDVTFDTNTLSQGDTLQWDGTKWIAAPVTANGTLDGGDAGSEYGGLNDGTTTSGIDQDALLAYTLMWG